MLIRTAKILRMSFRETDRIARIGGDEFAVIVRGLAIEDMEAIYQRICHTIKLENERLDSVAIPLHMSVGYAHSADPAKSMRDLLREADNRMYRKKLNHQARTAGTIIQTVKKLLSARDFATGNHGDRLHSLIARFATAAGVQSRKSLMFNSLLNFMIWGKWAFLIPFC